MAAPNRLPSSLFRPPASDKPASDEANSGGSSSRDASSLDAGKYCGVDLRVYLELKNVIHHYLLNKVDLERIAAAPDERTRAQVFAVIQEAVSRLKAPLSGPDKEQLSLEILDEMFGLGPLEPLLQDPTISDILVNGAKLVYVERAGILEETKITFKDDAHLMRLIHKIVSVIGRRVDESSPMVDARLADGSRIHVIIPPLAIDGPHLSIRRFGHTPITEDNLLANQTLTAPMLALLRAAVAARLNIVISGGTGSGKTTLLNVLSGYISSKERIVTIEDSAELQLKQRHVVRLECRPANVEGKGAVQARQLVINSLRMRPNRIVVGEVRGEEALDMLQAMNTGHDGSMTTIHANSPRDAIARMETMAMMANLNLPEKAIRKQIASAVCLVLQIARFSDGTRRITQIAEITGMEADVVSMQDLFVFEKQGVSSEGRVLGTFNASGVRPRFAERLKAAGFDLPSNMFDQTGRHWKKD
jgi:pilus assembly protein CpaF